MGISISGGGGSGADITPTTLTVGTGDNLNFNGAVTTTGQKILVSKGTTAAPDTTDDPLVKVQRKISIPGATIGESRDGADEAAAFASYAYGDVDNEIQPVGVLGYAQNLGDTNPAGTAAPDAVGLYGVGMITGTGVGTALGGFFYGRSDSADGKVSTVEIQSYNGTGSDHSVQSAGFDASHAMWITANGGHRSASGILFGNPFGRQFETGIFFNAQVNGALTGPTLNADIRTDSNALHALHIKGTHTTAAILVESGAGPVRLGAAAASQASALLEVLTGSTTTPLVNVAASGNQSVSIRLANNSGATQWITAAGADSQLTGTVAGDTCMKIGTAGKSFHIGGTASVLEVTQGDALGFFNDATPATKQTVSGSRGSNAALASLLTALAAYGLVTDSSSA